MSLRRPHNKTQEQQHDISDDTTDNKLERELLEERNWKEFKELCTANFDNVFRYIAEEYSQDSIGIMNFLEDFTESLQSYNKWRSEKKRSRENIHFGSKNLAANDE